MTVISYGTEQKLIFKGFLLEKICMYVYEIFPKYTWNIYVFITYMYLLHKKKNLQ